MKEEQKTLFFTNLAHETKTPLTLISNYLDKDIKERGMSASIKIVKNNLDKLKKDMVNFLDFQKLERGQVFYDHNQVINISEIIKEKIILFKEISNRKNIKIKSDIAVEVYIKMDIYAFDRIINNLIDNAIKYTDNGGEIRISLRKYRDNSELILEDTGIGIPENELEKIFIPYRQLSKEKRNIVGIGMGLSIVKSIIDEAGGKIVVESTAGKGTKFKINLKNHSSKEDDVLKKTVISSPYAISDNPNIKDSDYDKNKYNVFIIEDNMEMLAYLQEYIKGNFNFYFALNGKEALEKIVDIPFPDIIISDIMMDGMDGYDFYENLVKIEKYDSVPFVFLTAKTSKEDKLKGLRKGAVDFVSKPFDVDILISKINSILRKSSVQKNIYIKKISNEVLKMGEMSSDENSFSKIFNIFKKYDFDDNDLNIICYLADGFEYKIVADKVNMNLNTLKKRVKNIYKKLNINNKVELVNFINKSNILFTGKSRLTLEKPRLKKNRRTF